MKRVAGWFVWFTALWWLWLLLVGEWNHYEWIAATVAAIVGASLFEVMRASANVVARVPLTWVRRGKTVPHQIFVDFGIITGALVRSAHRREGASGVFRAHSFPAVGGSAADVGARAWVDWVANLSPNAIPIDIDRDQGLSLVHDVVLNRNSEKPA